MKNILIVILVLFSVVGCTKPVDEITDERIGYQIACEDSEVMSLKNVQYYEVYNNTLPYVEHLFRNDVSLIELGHYVIDLNDYSVKQIDLDICEYCRVISLTELDTDHYVYSVVDQTPLFDEGLYSFQIIREKNNSKEIIAEGNTNYPLNAPQMNISGDDVFFTLNSYDFLDDYKSGEYRTEFWKVSKDDRELIYQSIGKYSNLIADNNAERIPRHILNISENTVSFLSHIGDETYLNIYNTDIFDRIKLNYHYSYAIPIGDEGYILGKNVYGESGTEPPEVFNIFFDSKKGEYIDININTPFCDWITLSHNIAIAVDYNSKGWIIKRDSTNNISKEEMEVRPIYFRRISDTESFIYDSETRKFQRFSLTVE